MVRDARGRVWLDTVAPLFSGSFPIHDWRPNETLGERRVLDLSALPHGEYRVGLRLIDERGREVPVSGVSGVGVEVQVAHVRRPQRPPPGEWLTGQLARVERRLAPELAVLR
jgi:hypothetical protein